MPAGNMYVPTNGIQPSLILLRPGDEFDVLLTVGNRGKGPTGVVSAQVRRLPFGNLNGWLSPRGCTPTCRVNGSGPWDVHWTPLKAGQTGHYKIRFDVLATGTPNVGVLVYEGTDEASVSSGDPNTKSYTYWSLTIF